MKKLSLDGIKKWASQKTDKNFSEAKEFLESHLSNGVFIHYADLYELLEEKYSLSTMKTKELGDKLVNRNIIQLNNLYQYSLVKDNVTDSPAKETFLLAEAEDVDNFVIAKDEPLKVMKLTAKEIRKLEIREKKEDDRLLKIMQAKERADKLAAKEIRKLEIREKMEDDRLLKIMQAKEKADKLAADKVEKERKAKEAADKLAADKAAAVELNKEKEAMKAKERAEKLAADKAAAVELNKEKEAMKAKERADKAAADKAEKERKAKEAAEKLAADKAAAVELNKEKEAMKDKEKADKAAADKAEKERKAKEAADKLAADKAEKERKAKEAAEKLAAEKLEKEFAAKLAADKLAADKAAADKAEKEFAAKEAAEEIATDKNKKEAMNPQKKWSNIIGSATVIAAIASLAWLFSNKDNNEITMPGNAQVAKVAAVLDTPCPCDTIVSGHGSATFVNNGLSITYGANINMNGANTNTNGANTDTNGANTDTNSVKMAADKIAPKRKPVTRPNHHQGKNGNNPEPVVLKMKIEYKDTNGQSIMPCGPCPDLKKACIEHVVANSFQK